MKKISEANYTTYHNHRTEPYFTFIKNGKKTIEGRIKKGYYRFIKPNDHIVVYNENETDKIEVLVKRVRDYKSIKEMFDNESLQKVLPDVETIEQGSEVYKRFYTKEQEDKFGIVAIEIERI